MNSKKARKLFLIIEDLVEKTRWKSEFPGKNCTCHLIYGWACVNKGFFHWDSIVLNKGQACTLCYKCLFLLAAEQLAEVDVSEGAAKKKQTRGNFKSWNSICDHSRKPPAPIKGHLSKTPKFPQSKHYCLNLSEWPPLISNCTHFLARWFCSFPLFLTSFKRPRDAWCALFVYCMYCMYCYFQ